MSKIRTRKGGGSAGGEGIRGCGKEDGRVALGGEEIGSNRNHENGGLGGGRVEVNNERKEIWGRKNRHRRKRRTSLSLIRKSEKGRRREEHAKKNQWARKCQGGFHAKQKKGVRLEGRMAQER